MGVGYIAKTAPVCGLALVTWMSVAEGRSPSTDSALQHECQAWGMSADILVRRRLGNEITLNFAVRSANGAGVPAAERPIRIQMARDIWTNPDLTYNAAKRIAQLACGWPMNAGQLEELKVQANAWDREQPGYDARLRHQQQLIERGQLPGRPPPTP